MFRTSSIEAGAQAEVWASPLRGLQLRRLVVSVVLLLLTRGVSREQTAILSGLPEAAFSVQSSAKHSR